MSDEIAVFLNKVDTFAQGLTHTEQAMFAYLVADDPGGEDVGGFLMEGWPTSWAQTLAPVKTSGLLGEMDTFLSSGNTANVVRDGKG